MFTGSFSAYYWQQQIINYSEPCDTWIWMKIGETSVHSVTSFHILMLYTDNAVIDFNS